MARCELKSEIQSNLNNIEIIATDQTAGSPWKNRNTWHEISSLPGDSRYGGFFNFRHYWQKLVISPLFLFVTVLVFFIIPDDVFKTRLSEGIMLFLKVTLKRFLDVLIASLGLVVSSIFFLIIPVLIKIDSDGPVFYRQLRIGRNRRRGRNLGNGLIYQSTLNGFNRRKVDLHGQPFHLVKFRTMQHNAELMTGPVWASANDERITRVGRILRITHLDELPQFVNVLKDEMSIVGPRPERPFFVSEFTRIFGEYSKRFQVKPGITGSAQISNGYDSSLDDVKNKLNLEIDYIERRTFWLDLKLIFLTIASMLRAEGDS